jgi:transcriptional regulator with XRE-family HTH domain
VRQAQNLKQTDVAERAGIENALVSRLERGENVYLSQYDKVARALGFRNVLELFRTEPDPVMRRLTKFWPLLDESARRDVLKQVRAMIDADAESDATSGGA